MKQTYVDGECIRFICSYIAAENFFTELQALNFIHQNVSWEETESEYIYCAF